MSVIDRDNAARAAQARAADRPVYRHDFVDSWPACTRCEWPIRRNIDPADHELPDGVRAVGHFRGCACPGRIWRSEPFRRDRAGWGGEWVIIVDGTRP